jgi:hypothetical protein
LRSEALALDTRASHTSIVRTIVLGQQVEADLRPCEGNSFAPGKSQMPGSQRMLQHAMSDYFGLHEPLFRGLYSHRPRCQYIVRRICSNHQCRLSGGCSSADMKPVRRCCEIAFSSDNAFGLPLWDRRQTVTQRWLMYIVVLTTGIDAAC